MRVAFVWPFWQQPAKYDELRWSIRSVYQNFREPDCEIQIVVVGDKPIIKRQSQTWFSGKLIHVPRTVTGTGAAGIEDQCRKWIMALRDEELPDTIVWMMDDVYFIRPVTLAQLSTPRIMGHWTPERIKNWQPKTWWHDSKKKTLEALLEKGLPTYDFATHLPHVVNRRQALELLTEFGLPESRLLWECVYENATLKQAPTAATPFLRIISTPKCLSSTKAATERASVLVTAGTAWNEAHRTYLYNLFPVQTPVEVSAPAPPKPLKTFLTPRVEVPAIHPSRAKVTCVMNGYARPNNFPCQFNALKRQTVENEILVWQNAHAPTKNEWQRDWFDEAQVVHAGCNRNLGVWARFAFALNAKTEFVCVFDDDIVPGTEWLENCIETFNRYPGLLGGNGVIFHSLSDYDNRTNIGWRFPNRYVTQVDIVGHAWFMRREWLGLYWSEMPDPDHPSIAGEDFHASYMLQKHGIKTYVPQHRKHTKQRWSCIDAKKGRQLQMMPVAIGRNPITAQQVRDGLSLYVKKGFRLIEHDRLAATQDLALQPG